MNFGRILTSDCVNVPPPPDVRCSDPAFAIANPDICGVQSGLIIKPSVAITCPFGSIQFKAYVIRNGEETEVTADSTFSSGDLNVAMVGAASGNCTAMAPGEVTISAVYNGGTATAHLSVLAGDNCCDNQTVAMLVCVDTTRSMSLAFDGAYPTKLDFAKAAATRFISEVNELKDMSGLMTFHSTLTESLAPVTSDKTTVEDAIPLITQTNDKTEFYDALATAIQELSLVTADRKVIVLLSDGVDTLTGTFNEDNDPVLLLSDFKAAGGIVIVLGIRAAGSAMALLSAMSSGGFFINAYHDVAADSLDFLSGIKGYICAGNCTPTGDVIVGKGKLNYNSFINWDVVGGYVDLQGNGFFDYIPNNGLYVDLQSGTQPSGDANGKLVSKVPLTLVPGHDYQVAVKLAGNQIIDEAGYTAQVRVFYINGSAVEVPLLSQTILINDYKQDFHTYAYAFHADAAYDVYISVQQLSIPADADIRVGLLLNEVTFDDLTTLENLFTDNFDGENLTYIPPKCGQGSIYTFLQDLNAYGYAVGYNCYGYGCLNDEPIPVQKPDPSPQTDIESGVAPPIRVWTSTQTAVATCPEGTIAVGASSATATRSDTSYISQADADAKAYAKALQAATALLTCQVVYTSTRQYTATCPAGTTGASVTRSATATSQVSQNDADTLAYNAAKADAEAALVCDGDNSSQEILIQDAVAPATVGVASLYPSVLWFPLSGIIATVKLSIFGFSHAWPSDVRMVLMSPAGSVLEFMRYCGGGLSIPVGSPIDIVFEDSGVGPAPFAGPLVSDTYQVSQYGPGPVTPGSDTSLYPAPAPDPQLFGATLDKRTFAEAFAGENTYGAWSLWIIDTQAGFTGKIATGWQVEFTLVP